MRARLTRHVASSSPLSRAVETCLVALAPLLRRKASPLPVTLAPNAREHFRSTGIRDQDASSQLTSEAAALDLPAQEEA